MNQETPYPMTPFDIKITDDNLQMMKLLLPYVPPPMQKMLGVYVKFLEMQHALDYFHSATLDAQSFEQKRNSLFTMLSEIRPYLRGKQTDMIDQLLQASQMMEMFQTFQDMSSDNADPMSMMMGMLSPEQQAMFETYNDMFANMDVENVEKSEKKNMDKNMDKDIVEGSDMYERMDGASGDGEDGSSQA